MPTAVQKSSISFTSLAGVFAPGVTTQTAFSNKSARAATGPAFSAPAIGWLPMNCAPARAQSGSSSATTGPFTLPTSVTSVPGLSIGANRSTSPRICAMGVQSTTRSASRTAADRSVVARSTTPSRSHSAMLFSRRT